jgi:DNA-binding transcriptional MerR regulator
MQLFKAKQLAQKEVDKALADVGMTMDEVRAYLKKHPEMNSAFHRAPHMAGCSTADLVYEVGAKKSKLSYLKNKLVNAVTGKDDKEHEKAHETLLAVARRAAAKVNKKKSAVVSVAPEMDETQAEDAGRPPVPAGRTSLRVIN